VGPDVIAMDPSVVHEGWERAEQPSYRRFAEVVKRGDVVYDIGAHYGTYSIIAARRVGAQGLVVAFEPAPETRELLIRHLEWNRASGPVRVVAKACGARSGNMPLWSAGRADGGASIVPRSGTRAETVDVTTVDQVSEESGRPPALMKIDVEGAEFDVLRGAERTLATARPTVLLSTHPVLLRGQQTSEEALLAWLGERGYTATFLHEDQERHFLGQPR
jgi:FkbM family methyltransferase